jgi:hypothetical protein
MARSLHEARAKLLRSCGRRDADELASLLGDLARTVVERYRGDLRRLRAAADADPARERALLKQFKGVGDVGVDIFFREVQAAWEELRPFVDRRTRQGATALGLPTDPRRLARLVADDDVTRFLNALARVDIDGSADQLGGCAPAGA